MFLPARILRTNSFCAHPLPPRGDDQLRFLLRHFCHRNRPCLVPTEAARFCHEPVAKQKPRRMLIFPVAVRHLRPANVCGSGRLRAVEKLATAAPSRAQGDDHAGSRPPDPKQPVTVRQAGCFGVARSGATMPTPSGCRGVEGFPGRVRAPRAARPDQVSGRDCSGTGQGHLRPCTSARQYSVGMRCFFSRYMLRRSHAWSKGKVSFG